ncbi:MAG: hypothetical protein HOV87_01785 [Catenulispora sp.]|nr:hypothetical protein [Catenulispora sp.]
MWGRLPRHARWVAAVYVAGFAEGTCAHAYFLLAGGVHAYSGDPILIQVLFHAVLVLDALAVALMIRLSPAGPALAAAVMLADATANWWVLAPDVMRHPLHYLVPVGLLPITAFGVFVVVTALPLRRSIVSAG